MLNEVFPEITVGFVGNVSNHYCDEATGVPFYRTGNVRDGTFSQNDIRFVTKDFHRKNRKSSISNGDILIARVGANLGMVCRVDGISGDANAANVIIIRRNEQADSDYFAEFLGSPMGQSQIHARSVGGAQGVFNTRLAEQIEVLVPPLEEQRIISELLLDWNVAIQKAEQLISAKEKCLRHYRDALLRQPDHAVLTRLRDVTQELAMRNGSTLGRDAIMAVTKQVGMRPMREETIAADIGRYKLVPPGAFAYNPMRLNIGSITMSPFDRNVLVSPDYVVFACDQSRLLPAYLHHVRHTQNWKGHFELAGNGSVRVRIYYDDLGTFAFRLPPINIQKRIVAFLDAIAREIALLYLQVEALRKQKRGLMQKLLTGQWRLKMEEA